jgi:hypothetical protein
MASAGAWREWIERARSANIMVVAEELGIRLKKVAVNEFVGPCPSCGGVDRFSINTRKSVFNCRGSDGGGDVIAMVEHATGCSFGEACERITGEARPDRTRDETLEERNRRLQANAERLAKARIREAEEAAAAKAKRTNDEMAIADILQRSTDIQGTHAEAYMNQRGLHPPKRLTLDLRFCSETEYWGTRDNGSGQTTLLAILPALVAVIRDFVGAVIGLSITYLDAREPMKWEPPPHNSAKKIRGRKQGGMTRLGRIAEILAIGEGWENVLAWWQTGQGPEDVSLAAAVDLGNLAGRATGTRPHPVLKDADGRARRIQNGYPDLQQPGVILPVAGIKGIILVADVDSESYATAAMLATATRRFQSQGLDVNVAWPNAAGLDFNDVVLADAAGNARESAAAHGP